MKNPDALCTVCDRKSRQSEFFECSHVDCPNRRQVTAQPSGHLLHDGQSNLTSHRPIITSDEARR